jgi:hypothetical protein
MYCPDRLVTRVAGGWPPTAADVKITVVRAAGQGLVTEGPMYVVVVAHDNKSLINGEGGRAGARTVRPREQRS